MELNTAVNLPADADIYKFAAEITDEVMTHYEKALIKKITELEFPSSPMNERAEIFNLAIKHASADSTDILDEIHYERRRALIEEKAVDYLRENNSIIINGFVNFRLEEYKDELRSLCRNAADELSSLREYDEFLNMLRFFVSVQSPKETTVHLVKSGGAIKILNKRRRDITRAYCEDSLFDEEGFTSEDIVLSSLITISPRKIIIHDTEGNERIYDTISSVFPDVEFTEH